jgi:hypothetical protein
LLANYLVETLRDSAPLGLLFFWKEEITKPSQNSPRRTTTQFFPVLFYTHKKIASQKERRRKNNALQN